MAINTRSTLAAEVNVFLASILRRLENGPLTASYFFDNPYALSTLPEGKGTGTARFIKTKILDKGRSTSIANKKAQITVKQVARGSNPTPESWGSEFVDMKLKRIGNVLSWDDEVGYESPLIVNPQYMMDAIVQQYLNYMDSMALDAMTKVTVGTGEQNNVQTNIAFADPGNNTDVTTITTAAADKITKLMIDTQLTRLKNAGIPPLLGPVGATENVGTRPVPAAYGLFCTETALSDIIAEAGTNWIPAAQYNSMQMGDYWPEAGAYYNNSQYAVRVFSSNNGPTLVGAGASSANVSATIIAGKGAFGKVKSSENFRLVVVNTPDSGNRLALIESLGWRDLTTMGIVNDHACSLLYSR